MHSPVRTRSLGACQWARNHKRPGRIQHLSPDPHSPALVVRVLVAPQQVSLQAVPCVPCHIESQGGQGVIGTGRSGRRENGEGGGKSEEVFSAAANCAAHAVRPCAEWRWRRPHCARTKKYSTEVPHTRMLKASWDHWGVIFA